MVVKTAHLLYSGMGGLGTYFMNFVDSDKDNKFESMAIFGGIEPLYEEYRKYCGQKGIHCQVLKKTKGLDIGFFKQIYSALQAMAPDTLIVHSLSMTLPAMLYAWRYKKKIVMVDHTPREAKTKLEWYYLWWAQKMAHSVVYFYPKQFEVLRQRFPNLRGAKNVAYISKAIDHEYFVPGEERHRDLIVIGMAARMVPSKDHAVLIAAFQRLSSMSTVPLQLRLAGDGPEREGLATIVQESEHRSKAEIVFEGMLEREQLLPFYQNLDIYVHATQGETFCYSIMEAQACGLPIVASDVDGVNNILKDKEDVLLFQRDVLDELTDRLQQLIDDAHLRHAMGRRSRQCAVNNSLKNNMATNFYELFIRKTGGRS